MASQSCKCGHQKRDHNIVKSSNYGSCKICLCNSYQAVEAKVVAPLPAARGREHD